MKGLGHNHSLSNFRHFVKGILCHMYTVQKHFASGGLGKGISNQLRSLYENNKENNKEKIIKIIIIINLCQ